MLDRSFLAAVTNPHHPAHDACVNQYGDLLDEFEREDVLLVAVSTHLRDVELGPELLPAQQVTWFLHRRHRGVFAPVDPLYVGFQHRRAARGVDVADVADALTLVMCQRHKVHRIATASDAFDGYDIERYARVAE
jgi:hypothetical protein